MNHDHAPAEPPDQHSASLFWRSRYAVGFAVFCAIAAYFLLSEHRTHFFGALPFLLLLACPLMHLFMHGGHGGHAGHGGGHGDHGDHLDPKRGADTPAPHVGRRP